MFTEGIRLGLQRAFKHTENPTREQLESELYEELFNAYNEWFQEELEW
jgi:hypothetical protein